MHSPNTTKRTIHILLLLVTTFMLFGCATFSFHNSTLSLNERGEIVPTIDKTAQSNSIKEDSFICQIYRPIESDPLPVLPMRIISNLEEREYYKKINILLDYIVALRKHINFEKTTQINHYEDYLANCKGYYLSKHNDNLIEPIIESKPAVITPEIKPKVKRK